MIKKGFRHVFSFLNVQRKFPRHCREVTKPALHIYIRGKHFYFCVSTLKSFFNDSFSHIYIYHIDYYLFVLVLFYAVLCDIYYNLYIIIYKYTYAVLFLYNSTKCYFFIFFITKINEIISMTY